MSSNVIARHGVGVCPYCGHDQYSTVADGKLRENWVVICCKCGRHSSASSWLDAERKQFQTTSVRTLVTANCTPQQLHRYKIGQRFPVQVDTDENRTVGCLTVQLIDGSIWLRDTTGMAPADITVAVDAMAEVVKVDEPNQLLLVCYLPPASTAQPV